MSCSILYYNMSSTNDDVTQSASEQLTSLKLFNNKAGYGFITINENYKSTRFAYFKVYKFCFLWLV
jgi:hypothetical protein